MYFVDNIRWLMIVFVVALHAVVTYSNMGNWYYKEPADLGLLSTLIFGIFLSFTQAYFMGLLFLIAGYFVPSSFDRKGPRRFLRDRTVRLGVPTLIYMLFINTAINYYILAFRWTMPRPPAGRYLLDYVLSLQFLGGSGPMWFALALLIFSAAYAGARLLLPDPKEPEKPEQAERAEQAERDGDGELPGHRDVVKLGLVIAAAAFTIRLVQPIGTDILNMQLSYFSSYVALFAVGIVARRKNWLLRIPYPFGMIWLKAALVGGTIFWLGIFFVGIGPGGDISTIAGGLNWQSAAYALWESFFCLGVCLGLVVLFRERFNSGGSFARFMADNDFSVYVFHPPILILVTLALRGFAWHPLVKFGAAAAIAVPLCFIASSLLLRRIPLLKRVL
ncbi:MAG TPA: acyltransferase family protein [Methanothrix sp.]|nr:acyltransferase family protein [Methanothrix sp.]HPR66264.1 acyltransferase family protein [Methanothrix sp.]